MAQWMQRAAKEDEQEERKIELKPEDFQKGLEPHLAKMATDMDAKLSPVLEFINQQREEAAARAVEAQRKSREDKSRESLINPEDYLNDPDAAIDKKLQPLMQHNQALAAMIMRKETLEKREYYDNPEFKSKVDALIDAQPLGSRANPAVITNCYKTVYFDNLEDIKAGKIKSQLSSGGGTGTGAHDGEAKGIVKDSLSNDEKNFAKKFGISEENWAKQKRELEYV